MTEALERFVRDFRETVARWEAYVDALPVLQAGVASASALLDQVETLTAKDRLPGHWVDTVRELSGELQRASEEPPPLGHYLARGQQVVELAADGLVEIDAPAVSELLDRAGAVTRRSEPRPGGAGPERVVRARHLPVGLRADCVECRRTLVGSTHPSFDWSTVRQAVRKHGMQQHGGFDDALSAAVAKARDAVLAGEKTAEAGYVRLSVAARRSS